MSLCPCADGSGVESTPNHGIGSWGDAHLKCWCTVAHLPSNAGHSCFRPSSRPVPGARVAIARLPEFWADCEIKVESVHSSTVHNGQNMKQPKRPSADEGVNKLWSLHPVAHDSAMRRGEALTHAAVWVSLETVAQGQRARVTRPRILSFGLCEMSGRNKSTETESRS